MEKESDFQLTVGQDLSSADLLGWTDMSQKAPNPSESCDFLYTGDDSAQDVWMLLSATLDDADDYQGIVTYWRPASPLPQNVGKFRK